MVTKNKKNKKKKGHLEEETEHKEEVSNN